MIIEFSYSNICKCAAERHVDYIFIDTTLPSSVFGFLLCKLSNVLLSTITFC
jgi:hypothetical protein